LPLGPRLGVEGLLGERSDDRNPQAPQVQLARCHAASLARADVSQQYRSVSLVVTFRNGVVNVTQLRSFLEVSERGTVAAAAAALGYTPPAVSQHLAKLERSLNVTLFDRVSGQLALADAGRALVPIARELGQF